MILQHKKLPEGSPGVDGNEWRFQLESEESGFEGILANSLKHGILYLEDPIDKVCIHTEFLSF